MQQKEGSKNAMQGTDILESLEEIKEELEKLKLEVADVSQVDDICKIQNNIERLKSMLPKHVHSFNIIDFEGYVNWITQIEKRIFDLKGISSTRLDFIKGEIEKCKSKAEKRLQEKKNKKQ